jgi:hypothetical protein
MRAKIPTKLDSNGGAIVNVSILGGAIGVGGLSATSPARTASPA